MLGSSFKSSNRAIALASRRSTMKILQERRLAAFNLSAVQLEDHISQRRLFLGDDLLSTICISKALFDVEYSLDWHHPHQTTKSRCTLALLLLALIYYYCHEHDDH